MKKGLLRTWWFWAIIIIVLLPVAWYIEGYVAFFISGAKYREINSAADLYIKVQEKKLADLEQQYKNDPYGGATPQETLRLFVQALEKRDYTLASNYFIPEKVSEYRKGFPKAEMSGGQAALIIAYNKGRVQFTKFKSAEKYEVKLYEPNESTPFILTVSENPFTHKWLISEL